MFGLFCKGLHCAGCGRGIPASVLLLLVGIFIADLQTAILIQTLIILTAILSGAGIITVALLGLLAKKGPKCVYVRQIGYTYSQLKFLETGDPEWLELTGGVIPQLEVAKDVNRPYKTILGRVESD